MVGKRKEERRAWARDSLYYRETAVRGGGGRPPGYDPRDVFSSRSPLVTQTLADVDHPLAIIASVRYSRCSAPSAPNSPFLFRRFFPFPSHPPSLSFPLLPSFVRSLPLFQQRSTFPHRNPFVPAGNARLLVTIATHLLRRESLLAQENVRHPCPSYHCSIITSHAAPILISFRIDTRRRCECGMEISVSPASGISRIDEGKSIIVFVEVSQFVNPRRWRHAYAISKNGQIGLAAR